MPPNGLDNVDKGILYLLQRNARTNTTAHIGEKVGVSSSTVGNRIKKLEERGVITGYHPTIDYEKAGLEHHLLVIGTVPFEDRGSVSDEIMNVTGVVGLRELLTDHENLSIEIVGRTRKNVEETLIELKSTKVDISRLEMIQRDRNQPYNHFGKQFTTEGNSG